LHIIKALHNSANKKQYVFSEKKNYRARVDVIQSLELSRLHLKRCHPAVRAGDWNRHSRHRSKGSRSMRLCGGGRNTEKR